MVFLLLCMVFLHYTPIFRTVKGNAIAVITHEIIWPGQDVTDIIDTGYFIEKVR